MTLWERIKDYALMVVGIFAAIFTALFFFEKNKDEVDAALVKEAKVTADIQADDAAIAANNAQLTTEEQTRKTLENTKNTPIDLATYVNTKLK